MFFEILSDFGSQLGPWGVHEVPVLSFFGTLGLFWAEVVPRPCQDSLLGSFWADFFTIFFRFWTDFWHRWDGFAMTFDTFLEDFLECPGKVQGVPRRDQRRLLKVTELRTSVQAPCCALELHKTVPWSTWLPKGTTMEGETRECPGIIKED